MFTNKEVQWEGGGDALAHIIILTTPKEGADDKRKQKERRIDLKTHAHVIIENTDS